MTLEHHGLVTGLGADRQPQMQPQEGAGPGSGVAAEERRFPLVGHRQVASAVAIDVLDAELDLDTCQLDKFGFGDISVTVPAGRQSYSTRLDLRFTRGVFSASTP
jgi:hypothetical protein